MKNKRQPKPAANVKQFPGGQYTLAQMQVMANTVVEQLKRRGALGRLGKQFGDKRDLYNVLGYQPKITLDDYWNYFLREDIAKRIVAAPAKAVWRKPPAIHETDDPSRSTAFEKAWDALVQKHQVWSYFARTDKLSGIGNYGVMLMGLPGNLDEEVRAGRGAGQKLLFLSSYSQRNARITDYDTNSQSPRFGRPLYYEIDIGGDLSGGDGRLSKFSRSLTSTQSQKVHYSRVLHFADELLEDETNGTPRLEAVFNRLYDLQKVVGGSAEGYWRGAYGGFSLETAKDAISASAAAGEVDPDMVDEWAHGMRRWIDLEGYSIKQIEGQDFKPKEVFEVIIACISSATGIPQRILLGSERGELASGQDETNWKDYVEERRHDFAEPLIRQFIDNFMLWGILPWVGKYMVNWPSLYSKTDKEKSEEFKNYADGINKLAPGGQTELIATPKEIRTKWLDLEAEPEESLSIEPMVADEE